MGLPMATRGLSADSHTPQCARFTHSLVPSQPRLIAGTVSDHRAVGETAKLQSPFAPHRRYRRREDVTRLLGGRYSSVFARMGSCADLANSSLLRPKPRSRYLCRLPSAPAASKTFSTLFCESFLGCPVPCHGGPIGCLRLLLPRCHRPSPKRGELASRFFPRTRLFVGSFSQLQTFRYVQAPKFARLPDRSHRCSLAAGRPRLLHPGRTCFVASARTGFASRPNTGN